MLTLQVMVDDLHLNDVVEMMQGLYSEDSPEHPVDVSRFPATVHHLLACPQEGRVVLFLEDDIVCGYALLIPYWSNEFGGRILFIDELFVRPEYRSRGYAHAFFQELRANPPWDAEVLALEVSPSNARARRLYESLGFRPRSYQTMLSLRNEANDDEPRKQR